MERQGNPAVKWGLIFGGALFLLGLINLGIQYASGSFDSISAAGVVRTGSGPLLALGCLFFLLEITIYLLAGMFTARENGRVGSAAIAGLIAGLIYAIIGSVVEVLALKNTLAQSLPNVSPARIDSIYTVVAIIATILVFAFAGGIGAGIAALGGLIGRSQYERSHPAPLMEGSMYTPMPPNAGYPPAGPGQPGYPPTYYPPNQSSSYPPPNPPAQPNNYPPNPPQPPAQ